MKKTSILFCADSLEANGATVSLLALLRRLDPERYDVSLLTFASAGLFANQVPAQVHILPPAARDSTRPWGEFDVAFGFSTGYSWQFVCEKVSARARVFWVDSACMGAEGPWRRFAEGRNVDAIVCVSECLKRALVQEHFELEPKTFVVHNLIDRESIERLSGLPCDWPRVYKNKFRIVTVGRVCPVKGTSIIPRIAAQLAALRLDFEWFVVGGGVRRHLMKLDCVLRGLGGRVHVVGPQVNPYPLVASADVYVQPSRSEGWGMAVTEAVMLGRRVVASDIPAFREQGLATKGGAFCPVGDTDAFASAIRMMAECGHLNDPALDGGRSPCSADNVLQEFDRVMESLPGCPHV